MSTLRTLCVTLICFGAAVLHVARSDWDVDGVTVALIVIGAAPWLGAFIEEISTPAGGVKLREQVDKLEKTVDRVQETQEKTLALNALTHLRNLQAGLETGSPQDKFVLDEKWYLGETVAQWDRSGSTETTGVREQVRKVPLRYAREPEHVAELQDDVRTAIDAVEVWMKAQQR